MEQTFCQSCAMPMSEDVYSTNADGSTNHEYCKYCYEGGKFTSECTMEEMIEFCVPHMATVESGLSPELARSMMQEFFPKLKRWQA